MHFIFYARGIVDRVDLFESLAQNNFFVWERFNLKTKKKEETLVQGALRRSVLGAYEYIFPEECLPEVLSMFEYLGNWEDLRLKVLRKIFGATKIDKKSFEEAKKLPPFFKVSGRKRGLSTLKVQGVDFAPIGIKKDKRGIMGDYEQELL